MADKYIALIAGQDTQVEATTVGGTSGQAGDIVALDAAGRLDASVMPLGFGEDVATAPAGESLTAGDFVAHNATGQVVRASAAVGGFDAVGFVRDNFASGETAYVYYEGLNNDLTSLTPGARYYLSDTTPGRVTSTPVTGAGKRHQFIGRATSATTIATECDDSIVLA